MINAYMHYDWVEPGEWQPVHQCLLSRDQIIDELQDIEAIESGLIVFVLGKKKEFVFEPLRMCNFVMWLVSCYPITRAFSMLVTGLAQYLVMSTSGDCMKFSLVEGTVTADWERFLWSDLQTHEPNDCLEDSIFRPFESIPEHLPGKVIDEMSLSIKDFLVCVSNLADQLYELAVVANRYLAPDSFPTQEAASCESLQEAANRESIQALLKYEAEYPAVKNGIHESIIRIS